MKQIKKILVSSILFAIATCGLNAHPGRLDANGGHYNRKTGEYHFHRPALPQSQHLSPSISASTFPEAPSIAEETKYKRIAEYFRKANENVGALDKNIYIHKRDVSNSKRNEILQRDGYACVICGSTLKLEVDHIRALQNGGDNSESNLATLCDDCHTIKTRMDNSLRRKREKLFR